MTATIAAGVRDGADQLSWPQLEQRVQQLRAEFAAETPATVVAPVPTGLHLTTLLLAARDGHLHLVIAGQHDVGYLPPESTIIAEPLDGGRYQIHRRPAAAGEAVPGVTIMSSGSTGIPHPTHWPWRELTRGTLWLADRGEGERWALGYAPHTFAGLSATCQALSRAKTVEFIVPADLHELEQVCEPLDVVAATPSFWRLAVAHVGSRTCARRIVTAAVGGEPVDAVLLRRMREVFAPQRINQIFAASEFGTLLTVDDELPGLPTAQLRRRQPSGLAFDIDDGQLRVSRGPGQPFLATGDLVESRGHRVTIVGRAGLHINVGGLKVNPYQVAEVLQQHPQVLIARAFALPSPVLGQVVAAQVVLANGGAATQHDLTLQLKRFCAARLDAVARPMHIEVVEAIELSAAGKAVM